jgi:ABC-type multidrug transport system fused ATPase/permease subunit
VTAAYRDRATRHAGLRDLERRRSATVSRFRLATFLAGVVLLIVAFRAQSIAAVVAACASFIAFAVLVYWHSRIDERAEWHDTLRIVNERAIARIERRWDDLPAADAPPAADATHHPYAIDLDLFGRASLFQLLGPAATALGSGVLARWLLEPAGREEILERQHAVTELVNPVEWRLDLAAHGELARGGQEEVDRLFAWAEGPGLRHAAALRVTVAAILVAFWVLLALYVQDRVDTALFGVPLLAGIILSFALARRIQTAFDRAGSGERSLERYAALLEQATARAYSSPRLAHLHAMLSSQSASAPARLRQLDRILGYADLRRGAAILHGPIQALTLWDFWVLFALERWRRDAGAHVRGWLQALAEIDALAVLAALQHDHPAWAQPEIVDEPICAGDRLAHPLLPDHHRVANDVTVGPPGSILLVTGSNMSGKSTLLRAIGLNVVLTHAGACVCARRLRTPVVTLQTSIRVQDSLELGLSYFMAALARLKAVVDAAEHPRDGRVLLYLLDEILQGTNSAERAIAVRAVARHLLDAGAIGAMTTHDLTLAWEEPLKSSAQLVHFTETVDGTGGMSFDYELRPGLATSRNALRLMEMIGIDVKP